MLRLSTRALARHRHHLNRPFAAEAALAPASANPFVKTTSPVPRDTDHTSILAGPDTKLTVLPNGLRVATETTPYATTATVGVWIDAGSRFETSANNGTAHFLEHMAFKGTAKRTTGQLEEEVENMGGHLNAYTSREQTTYYAKCLKGDVEQTVDILSDILQNSKLDQRSVDREREVILREMQEVEGMPEEVLFDHLHATAFQNSPLGRSILGPAENVKSITKEDLEKYIKTHYAASRMVLVGSGAVDHDDLVALATKYFNKLSTVESSAAAIAADEPAKYTGSEIRFRDDDKPFVQFAIAFKGCSWSSPDAVTLMVMQALLGSWDWMAVSGVNASTGLAQRVSMNRLAQSYMAFNTNYSDTGLFGINATAKPAALEDLSWSIMEQMTKLCYNVDEEDLIRAKNQLKSSMLLHLDSSSGIAEEIGRQLLTYGRRIPKEELFARIDAVNGNLIKETAMKYIYDQDPVIVAMGKTQYLPDYQWFRRATYSLLY